MDPAGDHRRRHHHLAEHRDRHHLRRHASGRRLRAAAVRLQPTVTCPSRRQTTLHHHHATRRRTPARTWSACRRSRDRRGGLRRVHRAGPARRRPGRSTRSTAPASVSRPAQVVSDTRTFYDDPRLLDDAGRSRRPRPGRRLRPATAMSRWCRQATGTPAARSPTRPPRRHAYDSYGRPVASLRRRRQRDRDQLHDDQRRRPPARRSPTRWARPPPPPDPAARAAVTITDPNGIVTTEHYDGLGRLTGVWEDGRADQRPGELHLHLHGVQHRADGGDHARS